MEIEIENHPLQPFLPVKARLLMLGSFPPQKKRWSMDFYYPNLNNDMWRITGILFFNNKDYFLNESKKPFAESASSTFLMRKGLHFLIRLLPYAACKIMLPTILGSCATYRYPRTAPATSGMQSDRHYRPESHGHPPYPIQYRRTESR